MEQTYCICGQPYDPQQFMIQCDMCKEWFHGSCIGLIEFLCPDFERYHCARCQPEYGPPIQKTRKNYHRHNEYEMNADAKPVQTGTPVFIMELKTRHFPSAKDIIKNLTALEMNMNYFIENGFDRPVVVKNKECLEMKIPNSDISHKQLEHLIGEELQVDVIDVGRQTDIKLKFKEFLDYFLKEKRHKILNLISLEFSNTNLSNYVDPPRIVRELDWVNQIWPDPLLERNNIIKESVQKYLLMSSYDSFTDFHIDFGGSSVWYHLLKGQKIFYLIQPTPANLALYQRWMNSSTQNETFFGDQVDMCYQFVMDQGETLLIPTGWIHAVLTPIDSIVVGGNFLHSLNIPLQLQIYEIEKKIKAPFKYRYPNFEITNWFAAIKLLGELKQLNHDGSKCPDYLLQGLKSMIVTLKQWKHDGDYCLHNAQIIPDFIDSHKLIKDINKEIRHAERYINILNPPKPERESKRKKRKPLNHDFVDFSKINNDQNNKETLKITIKNVKNNITHPPATEDEALRPSLKITLPKYNSKILQKQEIPQQPFPENQIKEEDKKVIRSQLNKFSNKSNKLKREVKTMSGSIYDFHDGSDDIDDDDYQKLIIDEKPTRKIENLTSLRLKISNCNTKEVKRENSTNNDSSFNGIDQLLSASIFTSEKRLQYDTENRSGTTSPSTREAIAGMLSISVSAMSHLSESKSSNYELSDDYGENIDKVHQDEDYIYPTLDTSEDEDPIFKPRGKRQKTDEPWNPKARVGPLVPKINRPAREGTKKQSVEKGLEAAAAKRANHTSPKRQYSRKSKIKQVKVIPTNPTESPSNVVNKNVDTKIRKPKKGMATPKQRLGKILKIHKLKF